MTDFRTQLKIVRGHGSAREGAAHWWMQRVSAVALVPLSIWFLTFAASVHGADYLAIRYAIGQPLTAALMLAFIWAMFYHAYLGLQVVIEDYIHQRVLEVGLLVVIRLTFALAVMAGTVAVMRLVFLAAEPL
ncbi:MAG: succinate dehydrogenase, hydrophobic membrane anchor protein [Rhodanobacteraceae bacterium]|nr:succinate dehydrogenase, hydrophobic membrane anchor protein [Rhodanobacteraceae bacterium]